MTHLRLKGALRYTKRSEMVHSVSSGTFQCRGDTRSTPGSRKASPSHLAAAPSVASLPTLGSLVLIHHFPDSPPLIRISPKKAKHGAPTSESLGRSRLIRQVTDGVLITSTHDCKRS